MLAAAGRLRGSTAAALLGSTAVAAAARVDGEAASVLFAACVAAGLPHGAVDHVLPAWSQGRPATVRGALVTAALYGLTASFAAVVLWRTPGVAVLVVLMTAAYHFGSVDGADARGRLERAAAFTAYGLVPVLGPTWRWPSQVHAILAPLSPRLAAFLTAGDTRAVTASVAGAAVALTVLRARDPHSALEPVVLVVVVLAVGPLVAFGLYFALWHTPRHLGRVARLDPGRVGPTATAVHLMLLAAPTTVLAAAGSLLLWLLLPHAALPLVALSIVFAVTVPHTAVVAAMPTGSEAQTPPAARPRTVPAAVS